MRKIPTSAVALLTATGVLEMDIPAPKSVLPKDMTRCAPELTGLRRRWDIDIIVSSTIVADVFERLRQGRDQFAVEITRELQ
jgi:hypothetical protein